MIRMNKLIQFLQFCYSVCLADGIVPDGTAAQLIPSALLGYIEYGQTFCQTFRYAEAGRGKAVVLIIRFSVPDK